jgi:ABC-type sugar transport system permease subunit
MTARTNSPRGQVRWMPYFLLAPFLLTFAVFLAYPLYRSAFMAFSQTYGPTAHVWVGFGNFIKMVHDPEFWIALRNTAVYTLASVAIQLPLALGLALILNRPDLRGRTMFRLIFFLPSLVGLVFVAMMFSLLLGENGLVNTVLHGAIPAFPREFPWLQHYVMPSLILASLWMYVGFNMIYFLAALQSVNQETLDAAAIDGANAWQRFRYVVVPELKPVLGFVVLLSVIGSLQLFELPFVLLNGSGPESSGLTLVMYLYQNGFQRDDLGFASAIGWTLAILLIGLALMQRRLVDD